MLMISITGGSMGRVWNPKKTVEFSKVFSVFELNRVGAFRRNLGVLTTMSWKNRIGQDRGSIGYKVRADLSAVELFYSVSGSWAGPEPEDIHIVVPLDTTPCHFGGERFWFICPLTTNGSACRRRVAKLYLPPGAKYFGCRHCYDLSYRSKQVARRPFFWMFESKKRRRKAGRG